MRKATTTTLCLIGAALLATGVSHAADPMRVTQPVHATKADVDPLRTWAAPSLAVNPENPDIIVAGLHEFRDKKCGLMRSTDAGQSWTMLDADPSPQSYPYCLANNSNVFQASVAWGRNDTLYLAMVGWDTQDTRSKTSVIVSRSDDLGDNWSPVVAHDARPSTDPKQISLRPVTGLVVDTKSGGEDIVYVSYRLQYQSQPSGSGLPVEPHIAVSRDGGRTFEQYSALGGAFEASDVRSKALQAATTIPGATTTTAPAGSFGASPDRKENFGASTNGHGLAIDGTGNLYLAWPSQNGNSVTSGQPRGIFVSKSTDQGKSWTAVQARPFSYENRQNTRLAWSPEGGSDGTLHMVWEAAPGAAHLNSFADVVYSRSADGGLTWSEPKRIADDDPARLSGKYLPNVSVAPNGRVDVAWWDTRDDPGIRGNDAYYAYSTDNGETWSKNVRMTDQTVDRRFGVWGQNFDQNSPPGLASVENYAVVAWDDTRFSRGDDGIVLADNPVDSDVGVGGGVQDVFVSSVQFEALGGGSSAVAKAVLAGVLGLLAVGLVLILATQMSRRKSGTPPRRTAARQTPAGVG